MTSREGTNSAIGSWSGYIYQGLCGILVTLRMMKNDRGRYHGYALQLDGVEDFTIYDEAGRIYSMHQCKSVKNQTDYSSEFSKMSAKVEKHKTELHDLAHPKNFFHCNQQVGIAGEYGIEAYPFEEGKTYCPPGHIQSLIDAEIDLQKKAGASTHALRAALESLVNGEVLCTQQKFFDEKKGKKLSDIARVERIPFTKIEEIMDSTVVKYEPGDFLLQMKSAYILGMEERLMEEDDDVIRNRVEQFVVRLGELAPEEMMTFIQRINPKDMIGDTLECWHIIASRERINYLYNLITEFPLNMEHLDWQTENTRQTPSTLGNDETVEKISRRIYDNQANLDLPWLYDWIVGHVDKSAADIETEAKIINKTEEERGLQSIFHTKTVGIMTVKDKRGGKYD